MNRRKTTTLWIGHVPIGSDHPVSVQSMTNTNTADTKATIRQIRRLEMAGCDIIRVAVPDMDAADAIPKIKAGIHIPLVADIHFDYRLAIAALKHGVDGLRLNPGNIGSENRVREIVTLAREKQIPIRIGVNSGSLSREMLNRYGHTAEGLVESALEHVHLLEKAGYNHMKVSVKAASVAMTIESYQLLAKRVPYPLHVGVTEAGSEYPGLIKSAIGIGALLAEGIGDTIRVSLTSPPVREIKAGLEILKSLSLRKGLNIISCPTCGRTKINLIRLTHQVEKALISFTHLPISVAVMGCAVNGPGEAREADYGLAGGIGEGLLFKKGEIIGKVPEHELVARLVQMIEADYAQ